MEALPLAFTTAWASGIKARACVLTAWDATGSGVV